MEFPWSIYSFMKRHKQGQILRSACPCFAAVHEWINRNNEKSLVLVRPDWCIGRQVNQFSIDFNKLAPAAGWIALHEFFSLWILQVIRGEFSPKWFKHHTSNSVTQVEADKPAKTTKTNIKDCASKQGIIQFWALQKRPPYHLCVSVFSVWTSTCASSLHMLKFMQLFRMSKCVNNI